MIELKDLVRSLFASRDNQAGIRDLKSATRMMDELPENQVLAAMSEIIKALRHLNHNKKISGKERLRTITYLDEKTSHWRVLLEDIYFGRANDPGIPAGEALHCLVSFLSEMASAYGACLHLLRQSPKLIESTQWPIFSLRGMLIAQALIKWSYLRYMPVKSGVWRLLHQFYQFAEQQGSAAQDFPPYTEWKRISAQGVFWRCLLLAQSMPERLRVQQIELVCQWLDKWQELPQLESTLRPHHQCFAVDLQSTVGPLRLQRNMVGPGWRYLDTIALARQMQLLVRQLHDGINPKELGLPKESGRTFNIQLLQQLMQLWSRDFPAPRRRDKREKTNRPIQLICGLKAIIDQLESGQLALKSSQGVVLQMRVENESPSGLGLHFTPHGVENLQVGEVVGLMEKEGSLALGIVRRIARMEDNSLFAGLEFLARQCLLVEVGRLGSQQQIKAVYSPDSTAEAHDRFLLMPIALHRQAEDCQLGAQGKNFAIRLMPAFEYTPETVRMSFSLLKTDTQQ